jgi:hypothetical protein
MSVPLSPKQKKLDDLNEYIDALAVAVEANDPSPTYQPDMWDGSGFDAWVQGWSKFWLDGSAAISEGLSGPSDFDLNTYRDGANTWWLRARTSGKIKTVSDVRYPPKTDIPKESPPKKEAPPKKESPPKNDSKTPTPIAKKKGTDSLALLAIPIIVALLSSK